MNHAAGTTETLTCFRLTGSAWEIGESPISSIRDFAAADRRLFRRNQDAALFMVEMAVNH